MNLTREITSLHRSFCIQTQHTPRKRRESMYEIWINFILAKRFILKSQSDEIVHARILTFSFTYKVKHLIVYCKSKMLRYFVLLISVVSNSDAGYVGKLMPIILFLWRYSNKIILSMLDTHNFLIVLFIPCNRILTFC